MLGGVMKQQSPRTSVKKKKLVIFKKNRGATYIHPLACFRAALAPTKSVLPLHVGKVATSVLLLSHQKNEIADRAD